MYKCDACGFIIVVGNYGYTIKCPKCKDDIMTLCFSCHNQVWQYWTMNVCDSCLRDSKIEEILSV